MLISIIGVIGLTWEGIGKLVVLFPNGGYHVRGSCKLLGFRVVKISATKLDSHMLPNGILAHWRSCKLRTLRRGNSCNGVGAPNRGGTHKGESSQAGVCVLRPLEGTYQGYKCPRGASSMAFVFCAW